MTQSLSSRNLIWASKCPGAKTFLERFDHPIHDVVCSPDGKHVAACGNWPKVSVWTLGEDGERYLPRAVGNFLATRLCFSADSSLLACANPFYIVVWKLSPGKDESIFKVEIAAKDAELFFHPSGKELIVHNHSTGTSVWDIATSKCIFERNLSETCAPRQALVPLGYSVDGNSFMCSAFWGETFVTWHFRSGDRVCLDPRIIQKGLNASVLSHDRHTWTYSDGDGKAISTRRVGNLRAGLCLWSVACDDQVKLIEVSPDDKYVAATFRGKGTVCVWHRDNPEGKPVATMKGGRDEPVKIQFCIDGAKLLVATDGNEIFIWDFVEFPDFCDNADYVSRPVTALEQKYAKLETEFVDMARKLEKQLDQKGELEAKLEAMTRKLQEQEKQLEQMGQLGQLGQKGQKGQKGRLNRKPPQAPSDDLVGILDTAASRRSTRTRKTSNKLRH